MNAKYLGIIPARGGSKGIHRKNMAMLGDRPLLQYTIEAAQGSRRLDRCLFTSDDLPMIDFARRLGCEAPFQRPAELASDTAPTVGVVLHALDWLDAEEGYWPHAVVLLQPTAPFRDADDIDGAIEAYESRGRETLLSVSPVLQHPCSMVRECDRRLSWAVRPPANGGRQAFPEYYFIDGAIHIATPSFLRRERTFHDQAAALYVIERTHGLDIDDHDQLDLARGLLLARAEQSLGMSTLAG